MRVEDYFGEDYNFIWSDGWCIDEEEIWFMAGNLDILFSMDNLDGGVTLVDAIPSGEICSFRCHPRCVKKGDSIFCLPDIGEDIWCYHLSDGSWTRICVENPESVRLSCVTAVFYRDKLYIVSVGLKQIIELDVHRENIDHYYDLLGGDEQRIAGSVQVKDCIYIVAYNPACIYKFNFSDKEIQVYPLLDIDDQLQTICFDGKKIWLSGRRRNVYIWEEDIEKITVLNDLPDSLGIWNFSGKYKQLLNYIEDLADAPLFFDSISVGQYVWFIPSQTNEILYVDKDTFEIKVFPLEGEEQTEGDVRTQLLRHKYLVEYIKDNRYIGLFSLKNKWVLEIDCWNLTYKVLDCRISADVISHIYGCIRRDLFRKASTSSVCEQENFDLQHMLKYLLYESQDRTGYGEK